MSNTLPVHLTVNGHPREGHCEPRKLLVDFLREDLGLTGTHVGCEHGLCGACTVLVNGEAARSCLMLAVQADGVELLTIEGLSTPGMLHTALDLLQTNPRPTEVEIRQGLSAVLCRCTGYQGIVKAVEAAAVRLRSST